MTKIKPHISMILFYWVIMSVVLGLFVILVQHDPFGDVNALMIGLLVVLVMCFVFVMIFCNLPYFAIDIGELEVKGPSQFGAGLRKVAIPYTEFSHIVDDKILRIFGLYYIKSTKGKIITVLGCRQDQYRKLLETINGKIIKTKPVAAKKRPRRSRVSVAEKVASQSTIEYQEKRARRGSREKLLAILNKAPDVEPEESTSTSGRKW